jgi:uncharacterized membrane protein
MDISAAALPGVWTSAAWLLAVPLLGWAGAVAPWRRFASSEQAHVWYGTIALLVLLWSMRASVDPAFSFHMLGTAGFALTAGGPLALIGGAVVVALSTVIRDLPWANAALVWLCGVALPVAVVLAVLRAGERWLPPNFFVYALFAAFLGSALAFGTAGIAGAAVLVAGAGEPAELVFGEYVPYLLYLASGEATLTGMLVTLAVVYRPQWVATFDDHRYLRHRQ